MTKFAAPISEEIWKMKYQFITPQEKDGDTLISEAIVHDETVEDTWRRIAKALSSVEGENIRSEKEDEFYAALEDFKYLPAGRITAGAGTARSVTLFNCFVMGTVPDSMSGIFDMLKEAALTMQQGGGIGYDFSTVRPTGAPVIGVGSDASGPLSFMDVWNAMCKTIMSAGSRRGAMMATMRCDHPDVESFITAKKESGRLQHFNLSVLITDAFMAAVKADDKWDLVWKGSVWKTLRARELWDLIMSSTYNAAEPGVIFIDRINERNPLAYIETIAATNPCGEQPLPPYGACLLGSINMARLISDPFSPNAKMDEELMMRLVATAVRMMDNVVDVSNFPLPQQREEAKNKRRIGLGVTGLADALLMLRLTYGTEKAARQTENWMRKIQNAAYRASVELAKEKGAFPLFDAEKYLASPTIQDLDEDIKQDIAEYGIRNALLTSIAPTGTISLYAGNVSSGIEPVFAYSYTRKVLQKDGSKTEQEVVDYAVKLYRDMFDVQSDDELPDYFVSAQTLTPMAHVRMQAAAQKWVDSSISKTINCPEDINFEDFKEVYMEAFETGCKGCTTYRPNDITGSVLSVDKPKEELAQIEAPVSASKTYELLERPEVLEGRTYKLKWPNSEHAYYITINDSVEDDGFRSPFEIFIVTKSVESQQWIAAITRMISAVFRRGGDVTFVAQELREVFDPQGGAWMNGRYVQSLVSAIGDVIDRHLKATGFLEIDASELSPRDHGGDIEQVENKAPLGKKCPNPKCGEYTYIKEAGCDKCLTCGHSKCS
jgi:ribonucleoside-diphosphate reductase alpha chain